MVVHSSCYPVILGDIIYISKITKYSQTHGKTRQVLLYVCTKVRKQLSPSHYNPRQNKSLLYVCTKVRKQLSPSHYNQNIRSWGIVIDISLMLHGI